MSEESMVDRVSKRIAMKIAVKTGTVFDQETMEMVARAAIAAMREPTKEMVHPDGTAIPYFDYHRSDDAAAIWRAMIDAALKS